MFAWNMLDIFWICFENGASRGRRRVAPLQSNSSLLVALKSQPPHFLTSGLRLPSSCHLFYRHLASSCSCSFISQCPVPPFDGDRGFRLPSFYLLLPRSPQPYRIRAELCLRKTRVVFYRGESCREAVSGNCFLPIYFSYVPFVGRGRDLIGCSFVSPTRSLWQQLRSDNNGIPLLPPTPANPSLFSLHYLTQDTTVKAPLMLQPEFGNKGNFTGVNRGEFPNESRISREPEYESVFKRRQQGGAP